MSATSLTCAKCGTQTKIPADLALAECPECGSVYHARRCDGCQTDTWLMDQGPWICPRCQSRNLPDWDVPTTPVNKTARPRSGGAPTTVTCVCETPMPAPAGSTSLKCPTCKKVYKPKVCSQCQNRMWITGAGKWLCSKCQHRNGGMPKKAAVAWWSLGLYVAAAVVIGAAVSVGAAVGFVVITLGLLIGGAKAIADRGNRISQVGVKSAGGLACPKCGGTNFTAKRSVGGKVGLGLLAPKTRVRCVTCGATFTRG
jgi:hypothetical protein